MFRQPGQPLTEAEAVARCRASVAAGRYVLSDDAASRLLGLGVSPGDVRSALASPAGCTANPRKESASVSATWSLVGPSIDGAPIDLTVAFDGEVVLVL